MAVCSPACPATAALQIAVHAHNLASIALRRRTPGRGRRLYRRALALKRELLGADHPEVGSRSQPRRAVVTVRTRGMCRIPRTYRAGRGGLLTHVLVRVRPGSDSGSPTWLAALEGLFGETTPHGRLRGRRRRRLAGAGGGRRPPAARTLARRPGGVDGRGGRDRPRPAVLEPAPTTSRCGATTSSSTRWSRRPSTSCTRAPCWSTCRSGRGAAPDGRGDPSGGWVVVEDFHLDAAADEMLARYFSPAEEVDLLRRVTAALGSLMRGAGADMAFAARAAGGAVDRGGAHRRRRGCRDPDGRGGGERSSWRWLASSATGWSRPARSAATRSTGWWRSSVGRTPSRDDAPRLRLGLRPS